MPRHATASRRTFLAGLGLAAAVAFTRRPVAQVSNLRPT